MAKRITFCAQRREDGAPCTLEAGHEILWHEYAGVPFLPPPRNGESICVTCPTCREEFELALVGKASLHGTAQVIYTWAPGARRWLPRLRAFFRMLWRKSQ